MPAKPLPTKEEMAADPREVRRRADERQGLAWWSFVAAFHAVGVALWATAVVALYVSNYVKGYEADPGAFVIIVPLAYLYAAGAWRLHRRLARKRRELL